MARAGFGFPTGFRTSRTHADDLAVIKSCVSDGINHAGGVCQMNTGSVFGGRPSLGAWVSYGIGTENQNLPGFVVIKDSEKEVINGPRNWGTGFMPAVHQGVEFSADGVPIRNLDTPKGMTAARQRAKLDLLGELNAMHAATARRQHGARGADPQLRARVQDAGRGAGRGRFAERDEATKALYGLDQKETAVFGRNCLLARRLVEAGVRFVQLYSGAGSGWDSHTALEANHSRLCRSVDQPIAGVADGSEIARPARGNAGDLGRRVRPHADERAERRARSQPDRLHDVDGGRRSARRADDRRDR